MNYAPRANKRIASKWLLSAAVLIFSTACYDTTQVCTEAADTSVDVTERTTARFLTGKHSGGLFLDNGDTLDAFCSGTLIAPDVVLTAAHCVSFPESLGMDDSQFYFQLGHVEDEMSSVAEPVVGVVAHPGFANTLDYLAGTSVVQAAMAQDLGPIAKALEARCKVEVLADPNLLARWFEGEPTAQMLADEEEFMQCLNTVLVEVMGMDRFANMYLQNSQDIALVFLAHPISGAKPALLPKSIYSIYSGVDSYTAAGYGLYATSDALPLSAGTLHETDTHIVWQSDLELMLNNGGRSACSGDSGGGLIAMSGGELVVEGVLVRGSMMPLSGRCRGISAATKVSAYMPWIEQTLALHDMAMP